MKSGICLIYDNITSLACWGYEAGADVSGRLVILEIHAEKLYEGLNTELSLFSMRARRHPNWTVHWLAQHLWSIKHCWLRHSPHPQKIRVQKIRLLPSIWGDVCVKKENRGGCMQWGVDNAQCFQCLVASLLKIPLLDLHCQSGNCHVNSELLFLFFNVGRWILFLDVCTYFFQPSLFISVSPSLCILAEFLKFSIDTLDLIFCRVNCASYCL